MLPRREECVGSLPVRRAPLAIREGETRLEAVVRDARLALGRCRCLVGCRSGGWVKPEVSSSTRTSTEPLSWSAGTLPGRLKCRHIPQGIADRDGTKPSGRGVRPRPDSTPPALGASGLPSLDPGAEARTGASMGPRDAASLAHGEREKRIARAGPACRPWRAVDSSLPHRRIRCGNVTIGIVAGARRRQSMNGTGRAPAESSGSGSTVQGTYFPCFSQ